MVKPNKVATSGIYTALIGLDTMNSFHDTPNLDLIGSPAQPLHSPAPCVVLRSGRRLAVRNDAGSAFPIDVHVSGDLSASFVAPARSGILANGFE